MLRRVEVGPEYLSPDAAQPVRLEVFKVFE